VKFIFSLFAAQIQNLCSNSRAKSLIKFYTPNVVITMATKV